MIVVIDTLTSQILHNGKNIHVDPMQVFAMAPVGTTIMVSDNTDGIVTIKVNLPPEKFES